MKKLSYKSSGVDISKGDEFVDKIKPLVKKTFTQNVLSGIGNFGAFYKLPLRNYKNPVFVSSIDGVGTKLKLASLTGKFDTIGEDLVNHCVNDIAVCGAVPLFFMDYYATGKLKVNEAVDIVKGLVRGCEKNNCALIGGETAEMPGLYAKDDFDLAGSIVGIVEQSKILDRKNVRKGDLLVGIKSNGLHTNGYSLARKIFDTKKKLNQYHDSLGNTVVEELMKVHRSYLKLIQEVLSKFKIKSISHITGGGIEGNTSRVIPANLKLNINWDSIETPAIFDLIKKKGKVDEIDMRRTFNMGIGLIFILSPDELNRIMKFLQLKKEKAIALGEII